MHRVCHPAQGLGLLQRRLRLGYTRAARMVDILGTNRLEREIVDGLNWANTHLFQFSQTQEGNPEHELYSKAHKSARTQLSNLLVIARAMNPDIKLIGAEFDAGRISAEQWAEAVKGISAPLAAAGEEVQKLGTFAEQAGRNIQDALGDTIRDTLTGDFASIGERWRNLLLDMAAQAAAAQLNQALFGGLFGAAASLLATLKQAAH